MWRNTEFRIGAVFLVDLFQTFCEYFISLYQREKEQLNNNLITYQYQTSLSLINELKHSQNDGNEFTRNTSPTRKFNLASLIIIAISTRFKRHRRNER